MASKAIVEVIDDLDGSKAEETVRFAIDGTEYEVDLSGAHSKKLRDALKPFVEAGRKVGRTRSIGRRTGAAKPIGARTGGESGTGLRRSKDA